jgi:hypothetical protein
MEKLNAPVDIMRKNLKILICHLLYQIYVTRSAGEHSNQAAQHM